MDKERLFSYHKSGSASEGIVSKAIVLENLITSIFTFTVALLSLYIEALAQASGPVTIKNFCPVEVFS